MMTKFTISAYILIFIAFLSCTKAPMNGDLDGQWAVVDVNPAPQEFIVDQPLFYNFYMHVCQLSYYGGYFSDAEMIYDDNSMYLYFPYATAPDDIKMLKQYGILTNPVEFHVEYKNKNHLILSNSESTITLKKI